MIAIRDECRLVVETWNAALATFLGWPEQRVRIWAEQYSEEMNDLHSWFHHETSLNYLTPLLVPNSIRAQLNAREIRKFTHEVERRIYGKEGQFGITRSLDWEAARTRLDSFLREHGENIENVRREHEEGRHWTSAPSD